jgi:16S rRNA (adenine1518-N6/adenine1519-N6)-dimethyltransferase
MSGEDPRALLRRYELYPNRALGQNFLVDRGAPARIAEGAEIEPADTVLEVGAGLGTLTEELCQRARQVKAVETDPKMVTVLRDQLGGFANVEIVQADILELDPATLIEPPAGSGMRLWGGQRSDYKVVANLPYYITAAVLRHLLEAAVRPARMVLTVQREVAERMAADPGDMSLLGVSVQFYARPRILFRLKPGAFFPPPAVESAVIRLDLYETPPVPVPDVARFFEVVKAGFAQRRKQLHNTLASSLQLSSAEVSAALREGGIESSRRAETLTLAEWAVVVKALEPLRR